ncbi:hypothetical protein MPSEU_000230800 [Mayamaea pseudoterrestris]|nr:hypothetical protein MPSEU_000230800 [Mayamaea pseudoterrestris]
MFGAPAAPSPAPAFSFAPAPAAPTPAGAFNWSGSANNNPSSSGFGNTATAFGSLAPAPTFGSAPAPTPSTGFGAVFGAQPAANAFGAFGSTAPAPFTGLGFGAAPSAAPFGGGGFGSQQPQQQQTIQHRPAEIAGSMAYSQLSDNNKKAIDHIYQNMMTYKRTMNMLATMAPHLLQSNELPKRVSELQRESSSLQQELQKVGADVQSLQNDAEEALAQIVAYAMWPTEALTVRAGLQQHSSSSDEEKKDDSSPQQQHQRDVQRQLRAALDRQMITVDRIDAMPSPYLIGTIQSQKERIENLSIRAKQLQQQHELLMLLVNGNNQQFELTSMAHRQNTALFHISELIKQLHKETEEISGKYARIEPGPNVLDQARAEEWHRQRQLEEQVQCQYVKAADEKTAATPAPGQINAFGGQAPAPSGFGAGGGIFGAPSTPAPAPGQTSMFGAAPAPSVFGAIGGGLFGAPAPSAPGTGGGLFGAPNAAAPAPSGINFSSPAPAPAFGFAPAASGPSAYALPSQSMSGQRKKTSKGAGRFAR